MIGKRRPALIDPETGTQLMRYDHYRVLRLHKAWRVPVLCGKMPSCPVSESNACDHGRYALFLMMLFRPWRSPFSDVSSWLNNFDGEENQDADSYWMAIYDEYVRWRTEEIVEIAEPFFNCFPVYRQHQLSCRMN